MAKLAVGNHIVEAIHFDSSLGASIVPVAFIPVASSLYIYMLYGQGFTVSSNTRDVNLSVWGSRRVPAPDTTTTRE
jgi:hypothetical protein